MNAIRFLLFALLTLTTAAQLLAADRPNIVLIMADDIGVEGIGRG